MAVITIGNEATDRASQVGLTSTNVDANSPATGTGTITSIEVYAYDNWSGIIQAATFYRKDPIGFPNKLTTRDVVDLGNISAGYNEYTVDESSNAISLNVVEGDFIGIYASTGSIDVTLTDTNVGRWYQTGDRIPCDDYTFIVQANRTLSIKGTGVTAEAAAGNAIMMGMNF